MLGSSERGHSQIQFYAFRNFDTDTDTDINSRYLYWVFNEHYIYDLVDIIYFCVVDFVGR